MVPHRVGTVTTPSQLQPQQQKIKKIKNKKMPTATTADLLSIIPPPASAKKTSLSASECTLHLLPCKIKSAHAADVGTYWKVREGDVGKGRVGMGMGMGIETEQIEKMEREGEGEGEGEEESKLATTTTTTTTPLETQFRGRRLLGTHVPLPTGYRGLILSSIPNPSPVDDGYYGGEYHQYQYHDQDHDQDQVRGQDAPPPKSALAHLSTFSEMYVYGHDELPEGDVVVRGVAEWIEFSERVNGFGFGDEDGEGGDVMGE